MLFKKNLVQTAWFEYNWIHNALPSKTSVDLRFYENKMLRQSMPYLLYIKILPAGKQSIDQRLSLHVMQAKQRAKRIEKMAEKVLASLCARRVYGLAREAYYYISGKEEAHNLLTEIEKKWPQIEACILYDPKWKVYCQGLYPSMAQKQSVVNEDLIQKMKKAGDDILAPRPVNHYLSFPNEIKRAAFEKEARSAGYAIHSEYYLPESALPHGCCVRSISSLDEDIITTNTNNLCFLAEKQGGLYIYWACKNIRKNGQNFQREAHFPKKIAPYFDFDQEKMFQQLADEVPQKNEKASLEFEGMIQENETVDHFIQNGLKNNYEQNDFSQHKEQFLVNKQPQDQTQNSNAKEAIDLLNDSISIEPYLEKQDKPFSSFDLPHDPSAAWERQGEYPKSRNMEKEESGDNDPIPIMQTRAARLSEEKDLICKESEKDFCKENQRLLLQQDWENEKKAVFVPPSRFDLFDEEKE